MSEYTYCIIHGDETVIDNPSVTLRWTSKLPTKAGWYWVWFKHPNTKEAEMQYVENDKGRIVIPPSSDEGEYEDIADYCKFLPTKWLGPLPTAELPKG